MKSREIGEISPEQTEIKKSIIDFKEGGSITVEEIEPGIFKIVDDNITGKCATEDIAFRGLDDSVQNIDRESDASCFNMSKHLQWEDVKLTPNKITASLLDRLKEALQHIEITSYDPCDV